MVDCLKIRPGLSYWWMTLLAEKCNWAKSPNIEDAIRIFAFDRWVGSRHVHRIKLVSTKPELARSLDLWCKIKNIVFEWKHESQNSKRASQKKKMYAALPQSIQATGWLLRYVVQRLPLKGTGLRQWKNGYGDILFVSYLLNLLPKDIQKGKYNCSYWGNLPKSLSKQKYYTRWLHHYIPNTLLPNAKKAEISLKKFNCAAKETQSHASLESFLNFKVIFRTFRDWVKIVFYGWRFEKTLIRAFGYLGPLFINDWRKSFFGISATSNLLYLNLLEEAMRTLPKQRLGFYLQENQPWEVALIYAWRKAGHGTLVGVPHSAVRFWDLRYFSDPRNFGNTPKHTIPKPDLVAVNGPLMKNEFLKARYPKTQIVQVEALRYLHLEKHRKCIQNNCQKKSILRLLVFGEYLDVDNQRILSVLATALPFINKNILITFKPHPASPINLTNYSGLKVTQTSKPVSEILDQHDVALSGPVTTAAVEAYSFGLPVVTICNSSALNLSPLKQVKGVHFVNDSEELSTFLNSITPVSKRRSNKKMFFNLNKTLKSWGKIIKLNDFKNI